MADFSRAADRNAKTNALRRISLFDAGNLAAANSERPEASSSEKETSCRYCSDRRLGLWLNNWDGTGRLRTRRAKIDNPAAAPASESARR